MNRIVHATITSLSKLQVPRLRILALSIAAAAILGAALIASNLRDAPVASAHPHADRYNLCTRTSAVTDLILTELRGWGAAQSPADTRYTAASNFGCAAGQTADLPAADLLAHTDWTPTQLTAGGIAESLTLGSAVTSVKPGDFAGLNVTAIRFMSSGITELPARIFDGLTLWWVEIGTTLATDTTSLERIHPDAFKGMTVSSSPNTVIWIYGHSLLRADTIPPTVFDPLGDQGFTDAAANISDLRLSGPNIVHINTRWFASLAKTGTAANDGIRIFPTVGGNETNQTGRSVIDTYYYDDGDGKYLDGSKTTVGEVNITSSTTKATVGTAISQEIKRYAEAKTGNTYTIGAASGSTGILADATTIRNFAWVDGTPADDERPFVTDRNLWGYVDICTRTPVVRDIILAELRTNQATIYGTAADHTSGSYTAPYGTTATAGFGCARPGNTESAIVTKANLTAHTDWVTNDTLLGISNNSSLTEFRFDDLRYLNATFIEIAGNRNLEKVPDRLFAGLTPQRIYFYNSGLREFGSNVLHGVNTTATGAVIISFTNNNLTDVGIAPDAFDHWTNLTAIFFDRNDIGRINTRWFERLVRLGGAASWEGLAFGDTNPNVGETPLTSNPVVAHYYNKTGGYYDSGATEKTAFDPANSAHATALQEAISAKIAAYATATTGVTDASTLDQTGRFRAPFGLGVDPCDRNPAVWKELMRQFNYIRDDIAEAAGTNAWSVSWSDARDIRHARYANVSQSDCPVLRAEWVNRASGTAISDQTSPDSDTDVLSIRNEGSFNQHRQNFNLNDSDLSTLTPADFANFFAVQHLRLDNTRLEDVSSNLFAHMPNLQRLYLSNNKLKTADFNSNPNFLSPLDDLVQLDVNGNLLTRFDADWLSSSAKSSLLDLNIGNNPIAKTDLEGLNLSDLIIAETSILELDPAISDMSNLETFWWWDLRALPIDGISDFIDSLPAGITLSVPDYALGNPRDVEDAAIDTAAVVLSLAHNTKVAAIDTAAGGYQVTYLQLADPCRPTVGEAGGPTAWANDYGDLCLTSAQRDAFINSIDSLTAEHYILKNANLNDAQMATLLDKLGDQSFVGGLQFNGNPDAFGDGFTDTALSEFSNFGDLSFLRLRHHDLTNAQANTIMRNLATAFVSSTFSFTFHGATVNARSGLTTLDLSHNPNLFKTPDSTDPSRMVDVNAESLHGFLSGVFPSSANSRVSLNLAGTGLTFDQLRAILWSIETGSSPTNLWKIQTLDLSDNPNLWKRDSAGIYADVGASEITELLERLAGIQNLRIGNTGITTNAILSAVVDGLNADPHDDKTIDPRDTTTLERLKTISLSGNDLSSVTNLQSAFASMATRNDLLSPQLATVELADTGITLAQLGNIANGLGTADLLDGVTTLDISDNSGLFTRCPTGGVSDALTAMLARFTNLRDLDVSNSGLDFMKFQCIANGLTPANAVVLNARGNTGLFTGADGEAAAAAAVGEALAPFRYTAINHVGAALTAQQLSEIARQRAAGLSLDEQREVEREISRRVPGYDFMTPLPEDTALESGRGSLRVSFTHNPMYDGAAFTVLRYEYRYRPRPADLSAAWGTTGTEAWRTASIDLTTTGKKTFDIYGLQTETVYQLQIRANSIAQPATLTLTAGTAINLPEINSIKPAITEINMRAGDQVLLEVDVFGLEDEHDNSLYGKAGTNLFFTWTDSSSGGTFGEPNDQRRVSYTAPGLPGTYTVMAEAGPDGVCTDHHDSNFGITDADRARCQATFTVRVSRAQVPLEQAAEPINPAGPIPSSLADPSGANYEVFTPVNGGTFETTGITVTAAKGAVPDRTLIGVNAAVSDTQAPVPTPGARMSISGSLYDIKAVNASGTPLSDFELDEPLNACLPLPEAFRANISDVVIVESKADGSYGILTSTLRQSGGDLSVCGGVSTLPTTIGVAKLGVVPEPPATPTPDDIETPDTGATAPSYALILLALIAGALLLTGISRIRRITPTQS